MGDTVPIAADTRPEITAMRHVALTLVTSLCLAGCSPAPESASPVTPQTETPTAAQATANPVQEAVAHPGRSDADRAADATRKPDQVLAFFGIEPGMTVLDMFSGGGYYTELLSYLVGPGGRVHAHNNTPYLDWLAEEIATRYAGDRLPNVTRFTAENNALALEAGQFDAVLLIMSYHDIYHVNPESGWEQLDGPAMLAELFQSMKPGAVLGVVDHAATGGAPPETGETLHRIDPDLARAEIEAAGFVFEAASNALANPADDHSLEVFDDQIRGRTDRFVFRFRRP